MVTSIWTSRMRVAGLAGRRDVWLLQSTPERYHGIARPSSPPGVRTLRLPCC